MDCFPKETGWVGGLLSGLASYETGFGDMMGEFWLGNHFIHSITNQGSYELRVNLDSLVQQHRPFSTQDRDHDTWGGNCAVREKGAWWYNRCGRSNLNGEYHHHGEHITSDWDGVYWRHWRGWYSLRSTTMSVRRRN
ncbi:hypothetical protein ScPMuIL_012363 [Solemya velum]